MFNFKGKVFFRRNEDFITLDQLDLWHKHKKEDAIYNGLIAAEMLNIALVWFSCGEMISGALHLTCAVIVGVNCLYHAIWAKRAKDMVKFVEKMFEKECQINAENT